jgi:hypothetical protein
MGTCSTKPHPADGQIAAFSRMSQYVWVWQHILHGMFFTLQAALETFYGLGYIVGPMIGGILFSVSTFNPPSGNVKKLF